jgi:hypothetical protein
MNVGNGLQFNAADALLETRPLTEPALCGVALTQ